MRSLGSVEFLLVLLHLPLVPLVLVQAARIARREMHAVVRALEHRLQGNKWGERERERERAQQKESKAKQSEEHTRAE